jgi:hypothetical protein
VNSMNMKRICSITFFYCLFGFATDAISAGKIETVEVTGMGITLEKAIKNATKEAVRQVVGMYVVSEAKTKNRKLIKDEVLSNSNGFIRKFTTIEKEVDEDGVHMVTAKVEVEVGKVAETLTGLNIAMKKIDTENLTAQIISKTESSKDFEAMAQKVIFEPIQTNKGMYKINLNFNTDLVNDDDFEDIKTLDNAHFWSKEIVRGKPKIEDYVPIQITMKVGLKDAYVDAVEQFLEKNSNKKMAGSNLKLNGKYLDTVVLQDLQMGEVRGYTLGKKNARSMLKLNQQFIDGFHTYFKLTLLGEGEKNLGDVIYVKTTCGRKVPKLQLGPITFEYEELFANVYRTKRVNIKKFLPSGNTIATPMKPMAREERLSYDFDKSPRPNTRFLTCSLATLKPTQDLNANYGFADYAALAFGHSFVDAKGQYSRNAQVGSALSLIKKGAHDNAMWFGYIFLKPNIAKQLKSGKMEVITAELN